MHTINLKLPTTWQSLSDKQLRFVYRLLAAEHTSAQVKTLFLLRFGNIRVITREGAVYICKRGKERFTLSSLQIAETLSHLNWLDGIPAYPVRLSRIGRHRALPALLQEVPFSTYIFLDNLHQGYLQTQDDNLLVQMAQLLYDAPNIRLKPEERISIFYWFASLKQYFARTFCHFFKSVEANAEGTPSGNIGSRLQEQMNTQIRALTGGDITKEKEVLAMDCWRALTELDAKARDYEELKKSSK